MFSVIRSFDMLPNRRFTYQQESCIAPRLPGVGQWIVNLPYRATRITSQVEHCCCIPELGTRAEVNYYTGEQHNITRGSSA